MESNVFIERAALKWLISLNIITPEMLDELCSFLLLYFKRIKKISYDCDVNNYYLTLNVKLKPIWRWIVRKKKIRREIMILAQQYLPNYMIEVRFV